MQLGNGLTMAVPAKERGGVALCVAWTVRCARRVGKDPCGVACGVDG